jgi:hypothetical protein
MRLRSGSGKRCSESPAGCDDHMSQGSKGSSSVVGCMNLAIYMR